MSINHIKIFLILVAATTIYTSCTKVDTKIDPEPDPDSPDSVMILGFKDSTVLIKSLTKLRTDISGNYIDSNTFYIYYDSLNRKINFNSEYTNSPKPTPSGLVHTYDSNGLLIQLDRNDLTGTLVNKYFYDAQNVISRAEIEIKPGVKRTQYFTKKILPGEGYSLSLKDTSSSGLNQIDLYTFDFNAGNQLILMSNFWLIGPRSGFVDSIFYDATGNVSKVVETIYSSPPTFTINLFEFSGRATQGDQFYNFNKKVYNGISNFPEFFDGFLAGSPLTGLYNEGLYQFVKYPAFSNKIYTWSIDREVVYINFKSDAAYDSATRLLRLKLYVGRNNHYSTEYRLTYYK